MKKQTEIHPLLFALIILTLIFVPLDWFGVVEIKALSDRRIDKIVVYSVITIIRLFLYAVAINAIF